MSRLFEGAYSSKYDILILVGWNCPSLYFSMLHFFFTLNVIRLRFLLACAQHRRVPYFLE